MSAPVVTITSIILCFNMKIVLANIYKVEIWPNMAVTNIKTNVQSLTPAYIVTNFNMLEVKLKCHYMLFIGYNQSANRKVTAHRTLCMACESKCYHHGSKEVQVLPFFQFLSNVISRHGWLTELLQRP